MKGKRFALIIPLALLVFIGWIMAMKSIAGKEETVSQAELIEKADTFAEKELIVRAISLYERALEVSDENRDELELKLLDLYIRDERMEAYADTVQKRISESRAEEEEYIRLAKYYFEKSDEEEALAVLKKGLAVMESEEIKTLYESERYKYEECATVYTDIRPTARNNRLLAYDGEKWYYINREGKTIVSKGFDSITDFNSGGFAVVSEDGGYYVLNSDFKKYGIDENPVEDVIGLTDRYIIAKADGKYSYYNYDFKCVAKDYKYDWIAISSSGVTAVKSGDKWGVITATGMEVMPAKLDDVAINSLGRSFYYGYAMVKKDGEWYLVDSNGKRLTESGFADAKAPESFNGYIAVADKNGKWGFIDRGGSLVIPYQYDDAYSFSDNVAAVKDSDGNWNYISEDNTVVIEINASQAYPFNAGLAPVKISDMFSLIELKYTN